MFPRERLRQPHPAGAVPCAISADNMDKHLDAPYLLGRRSTAWSKIKCARRREFVVGGWTEGQGSRTTGIGSLALGCYDVTPQEADRRRRPQRLLYVGQAGSGLGQETIARLGRLFAEEKMSSTNDGVGVSSRRWVEANPQHGRAGEAGMADTAGRRREAVTGRVERPTPPVIGRSTRRTGSGYSGSCETENPSVSQDPLTTKVPRMSSG
jgi:hypothetical protein